MNSITLVFLKLKGGVGASTVAVELAGHYHRAGRPVSIIDRDPQGTAKRWALGAGIPAFDAYADPLPFVLAQRRRAGDEVILVDTPPSFGAEFKVAIDEATTVILPCRPSMPDIEALIMTRKELLSVRSDAAPFVLVTNIDPRKKAHREAVEGLQAAGVPLFKTQIHMRTGYEQAARDRSLFGHPEIAALAREITRLLPHEKETKTAKRFR